VRRAGRLPQAPRGRGAARIDAQVADAVKLARALGLPIVPRGAGTGLSGGALPSTAAW